jgi:hypothetical protein
MFFRTQPMKPAFHPKLKRHGAAIRIDSPEYFFTEA